MLVLTLIVSAVLALVVWWAWRAIGHDERKKTISWWAARNGWRYTRGTDQLLSHFRGAPFDRGTSSDVQDLLVGTWQGRPALIVQFSWYHAPDLAQSNSTGTSGMRRGVCASWTSSSPRPRTRSADWAWKPTAQTDRMPRPHRTRGTTGHRGTTGSKPIGTSIGDRLAGSIR